MVKYYKVSWKEPFLLKYELYILYFVIRTKYKIEGVEKMKPENSILNFITEVIPLLLITVVGLFKSKLLVSQLSTDTIRLYQLYFRLFHSM